MGSSRQATRRFGVEEGQVWSYGKPYKLYRVLSLEQGRLRVNAIVQREVGGALALDEQKLRIPCRRLRDIAEKVRG